jgi:crotonobetainyl-CoA:carnitine CoA-transferase CaiB-like acyl-CoA transferase
MQPLAGIRVLDFSTLLPGPLATLILAEAGAEVLKIERPPAGEDMRGYAPRWGSSSVNFALLNRGKKSLVLDLKQAAERDRLKDLIARADVLVEQFRPGVMARLGLDYNAVASANPRLIYCSISGYGQQGPKRNVAGHDLNYIGDTGLLALSMGDRARPVVPPALIADIGGGAYPAVMNILLALIARQQTGRGCYLDIAMTDNLFPWMFWALGSLAAAGVEPRNGAEQLTGGSPRFRLYPTSDGKVLAVAALEQKFWDEFCDIIQLDAALRDDRRDPQATACRCAEIVAGASAQEWRRRVEGRDCCCSIVATLREALDDPHFKAHGLFDYGLGNEQGARMPALPLPLVADFRGAPGTLRAAPRPGEHAGFSSG